MDDVQFIGQVVVGDEYRIDDGMEPGAVYIGEQDVVRILDVRHAQGKDVRVTLHQGTDDYELEFSGHLYVSQGYGDMEGNPWMPDELRVGTQDLLDHIVKRANEHALLVVFFV